MAIPTAPTATSVVTEGLKMAGIANPSNPLITRATGEWLERTKNFIARKKSGTWKILEKSQVIIPDIYLQKISVPTDFKDIVEVTFYDGATKGTMQTATASTIDLSSTEDISEANAKGRLIFITSGNAKAETSRIVSYNESTKQAGISPDWSTIPTSGDYMISDYESDLTYLPNETIPTVVPAGYPSCITIYNSEFYLDVVPDKSSYALIVKYRIAIQKLDLTDSKYSNILSAWRDVLEQGICREKLFDDDNNKYTAADARFKLGVRDLMKDDAKEQQAISRRSLNHGGGLPI